MNVRCPGVAGVALALSVGACGPISLGPNGVHMAVGPNPPQRPPFEVEERHLLTEAHTPPRLTDRDPLFSHLYASMDEGTLPDSGRASVLAWLLVDDRGHVQDVRFEAGSEDQVFEQVFVAGIRQSVFQPATFPDPATGMEEPVTVWIRYPFALSWKGPSGAVAVLS